MMPAGTKQIVIFLLISAVLVGALSFWVGSTNEPDSPEPEPVSSEAELSPEAESEPELVSGDEPLPEAETVSNETEPSPEVNPEINNDNTNNMIPTATLKTNQGQITLELFADQMPITVANFVKLAEDDFYNDTKFHRVIKGFMIQGGDPNSKTDNESIYGQGGPGHTVEDEFVAGELLTNTKGTIAMANTGRPNSGGSQWFINLVDNTNLDFDKEPLTSKHPVFGRVIEGLEVVDKIGNTETKAGDIPTEPIIIEAIEINKSQ